LFVGDAPPSSIRNIDEFYVVKNVLDDDGEDPEERAKLAKMQSEFETHAGRARRSKAPKEGA
jgi:hypothetical protein